MSTTSQQRLIKFAFYSIVGAMALAGGKLILDAYGADAPFRKQAKQLEQARKDALALGLPLDERQVDEERIDQLLQYQRFMAFDELLLKDRALSAAILGDSNEAASVVMRHPSALQTLIDSCAVENVGIPVAWGDGITTAGPSFTTFNRYTLVLCAIADKMHRDGRRDEAFTFLLSASKIASHLLDEPTNRALDAWASCCNRVVRTTYAIIERDSSPETLVLARKAIASISPPEDMANVVRNECLAFQIAARKYDTLTPHERSDLQVAPLSERVEPPSGKHVGQALEARSLAFWIEAIGNAAPLDDNLQLTGAFLDGLSHEWKNETDPSNYLSRSLGDTFEQTGMTIMRVKQLKHLVTTVIDLLEQRNATGELPMTLSESDPTHFDPFGTGLLHYRKDADKFILQALGSPNQKIVQPPVDDLRLVRDQGYALTYELTAKP